MVAAASGYGGYGYIQEEECPEGINVNLALLLTGAAIAAATAVLYFQERTNEKYLKVGKHFLSQEEF